MMGRNAQTTLAGQARLAATLGLEDPRHRRRAQGLSGNQDFYVGYGIRKDGQGRLEVDVQQIAEAICIICKNPPPPPDPTCDPLVDPCGCCPSPLQCDPTGGPFGGPSCFDPTGTCTAPILEYCRQAGFLCRNGVCFAEPDSAPSSGGCSGCGGDCDALAIAWLGF